MDAAVCHMDDVLSGDRITFSAGECQIDAGEVNTEGTFETILFTGCSLINYAPNLAAQAYRTLRKKKAVDGLTMQCCGRILEFAPGMEDVLAAFEERLMNAFTQHGVKRIIAACPNCCSYLEEHIAQAGLDIEVVPLPKALKDAGCEISLPLFAEGPLAVHDSCPDRETGRYAESIRSLLKPEDYVEMEHNRAHSHCCGSKVLAAGKEEAAQKLAGARIAEAQDANARGIVTACMSCTSLLSACSESTPVYHYLELLYGHRIPWKSTSQLLAVQFLLDENRPTSGTYYVARP